MSTWYAQAAGNLSQIALNDAADGSGTAGDYTNLVTGDVLDRNNCDVVIDVELPQIYFQGGPYLIDFPPVGIVSSGTTLYYIESPSVAVKKWSNATFNTASDGSGTTQTPATGDTIDGNGATAILDVDLCPSGGPSLYAITNFTRLQICDSLSTGPVTIDARTKIACNLVAPHDTTLALRLNDPTDSTHDVSVFAPVKGISPDGTLGYVASSFSNGDPISSGGYLVSFFDGYDGTGNAVYVENGGTADFRGMQVTLNDDGSTLLNHTTPPAKIQNAVFLVPSYAAWTNFNRRIELENVQFRFVLDGQENSTYLKSGTETDVSWNVALPNAYSIKLGEFIGGTEGNYAGDLSSYELIASSGVTLYHKTGTTLSTSTFNTEADGSGTDQTPAAGDTVDGNGHDCDFDNASWLMGLYQIGNFGEVHVTAPLGINRATRWLQSVYLDYNLNGNYVELNNTSMSFSGKIAADWTTAPGGGGAPEADAYLVDGAWKNIGGDPVTPEAGDTLYVAWSAVAASLPANGKIQDGESGGLPTLGWSGSYDPLNGLTWPSAGDLRENVTVVSPMGNIVGNVILPPEAKVEAQYQYGAGGTELTGSLPAGSGLTKQDVREAMALDLGPEIVVGSSSIDYFLRAITSSIVVGLGGTSGLGAILAAIKARTDLLTSSSAVVRSPITDSGRLLTLYRGAVYSAASGTALEWWDDEGRWPPMPEGTVVRLIVRLPGHLTRALDVVGSLLTDPEAPARQGVRIELTSIQSGSLPAGYRVGEWYLVATLEGGTVLPPLVSGETRYGGGLTVNAQP